eukprot:3273029-Rhodomonas_salina.1
MHAASVWASAILPSHQCVVRPQLPLNHECRTSVRKDVGFLRTCHHGTLDHFELCVHARAQEIERIPQGATHRGVRPRRA